MKLEKAVERPHCFYDGESQYKVYDKEHNESYCALSDNDCPYHELVRNRDYCKYIGNYHGK